MAAENRYQDDIDVILSHRQDQGWDYWTTPDRRLSKGGPFSTLESALLLLELDMDPACQLFREVADLIFSCWREDGRFRLAPQGAIYPCQTISAAHVLARLGYADDPRLQRTCRYLLDTQHEGGGWRCNKFSFGRGPETEAANPGPTLTALSLFRQTEFIRAEPSLGKAVDFLLSHWTTRLPLGPCHYGIGTLFMQPEYPFSNYNLFNYVYTLSFYPSALQDVRFLEALACLQARLVDGRLVVERVSRQLAGLSFCRKGEPSELGTRRYLEILANLR